MDTTILKIIQNPLYKGDYIQGKNTPHPVYYENEPIDTMTVKDLTLRQRDDSLCFYTDEEIAVYQNLANAIARVRDKKEKQESSPKKLILQSKKQSPN